MVPVHLLDVGVQLIADIIYLPHDLVVQTSGTIETSPSVAKAVNSRSYLPMDYKRALGASAVVLAQNKKVLYLN
jgi:hypothetical protein